MTGVHQNSVPVCVRVCVLHGCNNTELVLLSLAVITVWGKWKIMQA